MRLATSVLALSVIVIGFAAPVASADDLYPPFWRGLPNTSYAQWEFPTNANPAIVDAGVLPWGPPSLVVTPGNGQDYLDSLDGRQGVWPLSGWFVVDMQDDPTPRPFKEIWMQLTWHPQNETSFPTVWQLDPAGPIVTNPLNEYPLANGWLLSIFHLQIQPNPSHETFKIEGAIYADEFVMDTWCVPEPGALLLLALGGLMALRRSR